MNNSSTYKEDEDIMDAEEQGQVLKGTSYKDILLEHYRRILQISCEDFDKPNQNKGDARNRYCNAVESLFDTLHNRFDKTMQGHEEEFKTVLATKRKAFDDKVQRVNKNTDACRTLNEEWRTEKQFTYHILFQRLSDFLDREGYLETGGIHDK